MESETTTPQTEELVQATAAPAPQEPDVPAEPDAVEEHLQRRIRIVQNLPADMAERRELLAQLLSDRFVTHEPNDVLVGLHAEEPASLLARCQQELADHLLRKKEATKKGA